MSVSVSVTVPTRVLQQPPVGVGYLHHRRQISGGEHSLLMLWQHLNRACYRPVLLGPSDGEFAAAAAELDVDCIGLAFPRFGDYLGSGWAQIDAIRDAAASADLRILHGNTPHTNVAAALAGRRSRHRVIWHQRTLPRKRELDVEPLLGWLADRIICNSAAVARRFGSTNERIEVIHNGVALDRFAPDQGGTELRGELGLDPDHVVVGIVGNFSPVKRHELFIDAARLLARHAKRARFLIVGGEIFPENRGRENALRRLVEEAGLSNQVHFIGVRQDMPAVMDALDVFVATAEAEACSRAAVEAMAAGTPVVAAASGGNPELVAAGETGLLFAPDSGGALVEALELLVSDAERRRTMGRAARQRATEHFGIERQVSAIEGVYAKVLGGA